MAYDDLSRYAVPCEPEKALETSSSVAANSKEQVAQRKEGTSFGRYIIPSSDIQASGNGSDDQYEVVGYENERA